MKKKNILFILQGLPWPLSTGGNQAMFNGIAALKGVANIYVTYMLYNVDSQVREREAFVKTFNENVIVIPYVHKRNTNTLRKKIAKIFDLLDRYIFKNDRDCFLEKQLLIRNPFQEEIVFMNDLIEKYHIDIVQVEMLRHLALVNTFPQKVRKVFVHHELGFVRKTQILQEIGGNEYYQSIVETMKIEEIGLLNKYDDVVVLSNIDKHKLLEAGVKVPIHTSFAIIKQPENFNPVIDDYHDLFFVGPSEHKPNYFAVKWFLDKCWKKLLEKDCNFRFKIIGRWDKESIDNVSMNHENIEFLGFVDSLANTLKNGIMIVPITIGSGIRMKILEAAANGVPIVSTTVGAEGLPIDSGKNGFLADTPEEFVEDILKLSDKGLREIFVKSLNDVIKKQYSIKALTKNRIEILGLE